MGTASLEILEEIGVIVEDDATLKILHEAGALVDRRTKNAKIPGGLVEECIRSSPKSITVARGDRKNDIMDWNTGEHRPSTKGDVDKLCLMGYIDSIRVLPTGNSADLGGEIKARLNEG